MRTTHFVLAPSGSGKSWLARTFPSDFVDADHIPVVRRVYMRLDSQFGPCWFDRPDYKLVIRDLKAKAMIKAFKSLLGAPSLTGKFILTAETTPILDIRKTHTQGHQLGVVIWVPPARRLTENQAARAAGAKVITQPTYDLERNYAAVQHFESLASKHGLPIIRCESPLPVDFHLALARRGS